MKRFLQFLRRLFGRESVVAPVAQDNPNSVILCAERGMDGICQLHETINENGSWRRGAWVNQLYREEDLLPALQAMKRGGDPIRVRLEVLGR